MRAAEKDELRPLVCWRGAAVGLSFVVNDFCVTGACRAALLTSVGVQLQSSCVEALQRPGSRQASAFLLLSCRLCARLAERGTGAGSKTQNSRALVSMAMTRTPSTMHQVD